MDVHINTAVNYQANPSKSATKIAFILVTSLFFMWGLSHGLLDVLNKHFQDSLHVTKAQSGFVQAAYYGAYFLVALPIGIFMERFGYKSGIQIGLGLFALGALLFIPATNAGAFSMFLIALFVLACGLGCLETAANLYASVLGAPEHAERRLNLAQSFNGLGVFVGPLIGGALFFAPHISLGQLSLDPVMFTYVCLALVVVIMMIIFARTPLPEIQVATTQDNKINEERSIWSYSNFTGALIAQFSWIAAHVGICAFFINFAIDHWTGLTPQKASFLLSIGLIVFMVGRFISTLLMRSFSPRKMLVAYAMINVVLCGIVVSGLSIVSIYALILSFFFSSIMYPTIFAMGVKNLGSHTKKAGSLLVMTLVGGAISPYFMGLIADLRSIELAFIIPTIGFAAIGIYAWLQKKING
ncbi:sugar MFS transporter [Acinetobacter baumannii]|uniref:sugar MFS transporter n=1 Tax=Acinetobacter baumannii TaxID=470 RepID=UPI0019007838|nr:sugar MFS transporter [Acinetobacter baumannii]MBJ9493361.1 sugar MFS transporter [Acinetobacter baumannii]MCT9183642.1 sugar MFS transporter [Acinetobacter baumannii]MCT9224280.1 sugar MFS transporter [Acinetobacter baumannii]MCT9276139.1 sugar MFS transporter [Acinetobacter baumannii]